MLAAKFSVQYGKREKRASTVSRIGRKPIEIPENVQVQIQDDRTLRVQGPKGELTWKIPEGITWKFEDGQLVFERHSEEKHQRALHGLTRALVASMIEGVTNGFTKTLEIQGVGYRAEMRGKYLVLYVGYSHPVAFFPPDGIEIQTPSQTKITIHGIDKQLVGEVAAKIRSIRPPEPYKGKGIRYAGEWIRRKAGKAGAK